MKIIGLTGGIGSGKSTVATFFLELGVPVYFADAHAKRLMQQSKVVRKKLVAEFGEGAFRNGKLNRAYLADIVFHDKSKLAAINAIVHPSVGNSFKRWVGKQQATYVIQENAILFESNAQDKFDYTVVVTAPVEDRIQRVMSRDGSKRAQVVARIENQLSDNEKIEKADFVITNLDLKKTKAQVLQIHKKIMAGEH